MSRNVSKKKRASKRGAAREEFDKYRLYHSAVQSVAGDAEFFDGLYEELRGRKPVILREDFCGGAALCAQWVKDSPKHVAYGIDLDPEPLAYGKKAYWEPLKDDQKKRMHMLRKDVLSRNLPKADVSVALNFSYYLFKTRPMMKQYIRNVYAGLKPGGIAVFDTFGGSQCQDAIEDKAKYKGFTYYWDQKGFDPVSNEADFAIHFKIGPKKHLNVFTYEWRMWSIPELRDLMEEVGFRKIHVYWEGTARDGSGNGKFTRVEKGEACLSWIAYIVAEK